MDNLYKIIGKRIVGTGVKLILTPIEMKNEPDTNKILRNLGGFMENMKADAIKSRNPDSLTITEAEYNKGTYELGSVITISINAGE